MADNNVQSVSIHQSKVTNWAVAEKRCLALIQSFVKLGEDDLAKHAKAILVDVRRGFDEAYNEVM